MHITLQLIHIPIIHKTLLLDTFFPGKNYRQLPWSWAFFERFRDNDPHLLSTIGYK
jgi:hypothetical protein